jgi:hypothetical protein
MTRLLLTISLCFSIFTLSAQKDNQTRTEVYFATDKHELTKDSRTILEELNKTLKQYPSFTIFVKGNTDADGSNSYNQQLSEKRVKAVRAYLSKLGIPADAFNVIAVGEEEPIADNNSADGKQKNRRVDIIINYGASNSTTNTNSTTSTTPNGLNPNILSESNKPLVEKTTGKRNENISPFEKGKKYPIQKLYNILDDSSRVFKVKNEGAFSIVCTKGTVMSFDAHTFNVPQGDEIVLKVKEAYTWSDIIAANLGTQAGEKLLITAGMVQIEAFHNDKPIQAEKDYMLLMPSKNKRDDGMQLFVGNRENDGSSSMNWSLPSTKNYAFFLETKNLTAQRERLEARVKELADTCGCSRMFQWEIDSVYLATLKKKNEPSPPQYIISDERPAFYHFDKINDVDTLSKLCKRLAMWAEGTHSWHRRIKWHDKHSMLEPQLYKENNATTYEDLIVNSRKQLAIFEKAEAAYLRDKAQIPAINEAGFHIFETRQIGWINCDAFSNYKPEQLIALAVEMPMLPSADVKLIFPSKRMAMNFNKNINGRFAAFNGIPENEKAIIVAMKIENGESYLSIEEVIVTKKTFKPKYEKLSPELLKSRLKMLDNLMASK